MDVYWQPQKVFKANWTYPSSRLANCSRSFSYFCNESVCEAQEMSLNKRLNKLSMNYVLKLKTCSNKPFMAVFEPPNWKVFEKSSLTPRILPLSEDSTIDLDVVEDITVSDTPSWSRYEPYICVSLTKLKKKKTAPTLKSINKLF